MLFCKRHLRSKNLSQVVLSFFLVSETEELGGKKRNRKIGFHQKTMTPELEEAWVCGCQALGGSSSGWAAAGPCRTGRRLKLRTQACRGGRGSQGRGIHPPWQLLKGRPQVWTPRHLQDPQHRAWCRGCPVATVE